MKNSEKIKKLLDAGFNVEVFDEKPNEYCVIIKVGDYYKRSAWRNNTKFCYDDNFYVAEYALKIFDKYDLKITPIPHLYKEIKGKVDILDCPEMREMAERTNWNKDKREMIGQKGFNVCKYCDDDQSYEIYTKDKTDWYIFPAWAVVPSFEEENPILEKDGKRYEVKIIREI